MHFALLLLFFSLTLATDQRIFELDFESLPDVHHKDLVESLLSPQGRKRSLENEEFFVLGGLKVHLNNEEVSFVVKPAFPFRQKLLLNGEEVTYEHIPIYSGYAYDDLYTTMAISFPDIRNTSMTEHERKRPVGEIWTSDGQVHFFGHNDNDITIHHRENKVLNIAKKRGLQQSGGNGLPSGLPMLQLDLLIGFDSAASRTHGGDAGFINHYSPIIALTKTIYERDLVLTINLLSIRQISVSGIGTAISNAGLNAWARVGQSLPEVSRIDYAYYALQGPSFGTVGLSWLEVCTTTHKWGYGFTDGKFGGSRLSGEGTTFAHETGHGVGSPHSWDYSPPIDPGPNVANSCPRDGGVIMSYCAGGTVPTMGKIGAHGSNSERVNVKIRNNLQQRSCISGGSGGGVPPSVPISAPRSSVSPPPVRVPTSTRVPTRTPTRSTTPPSGTCQDRFNNCNQFPTSQCQADPKFAEGCCFCRGGSSAGSSAGAKGVDTKPGRCTNTFGFSCSRFPVSQCMSDPSFLDGCLQYCGRCGQMRQVEEEVEVAPSPSDGLAAYNAPGKPTVLYNQGERCASNKGSPSVSFSRKSGSEDLSANARSADDFIVPAGKTWEITSLKVLGIWKKIQNPEKVILIRATIFTRRHPVCHVEGIIQKSEKDIGTAEVVLTRPCVVSGGYVNDTGVIVYGDETHWLSVYPDFESGSENYFYWAFSMTKNGNPFQFRDRQDVLKKGCKPWSDGRKCVESGKDFYDLCFTLSGNSRDISQDDFEKLNVNRFPTSAQGRGYGGMVGEDGGELMGADVETYGTAHSSLSNLVSGEVAEHENTMTTTITVETDVDGTPTWVIPVAVVLGVLATILAVVLIVVFVKKKKDSQMETF